MKLPNRENAFIPRAKLENYLLSENHPIGKSKAKFFRMFGYDELNIDLLTQDFITIAQTQEVSEEIFSPHGKKYIIDGPLHTPIGRFVEVRTVWIIDKGQSRPRFVTAYPN